MKHISWLLIALVLVAGCGRDKKKWRAKIDSLVQRANACTSVACAEAVAVEMSAIVGSDEGQDLDEGEPELMFHAADLIRTRAADLAADAADAKLRATSPLTALQVFETTLGACALAYTDLHGQSRAEVEAAIGKVGAVLPPDQVPKAKAPGGLFWMDAFIAAFVTAMDGKVPVEYQLYAKVAEDLCILNYRYAAANGPRMYGTTIGQLARVMGSLHQELLVAEVIAAVRAAAPAEQVSALTKKAVQAIRASLAPAK